MKNLEVHRRLVDFFYYLSFFLEEYLYVKREDVTYFVTHYIYRKSKLESGLQLCVIRYTSKGLMIGNFCHPSLYSADRRANGGFARIIDYSKPVAKNALFPDARTHATSPPLLVINESTENQLFGASESSPLELAIKLINSKLLQRNALYQLWKPLGELLRACKFRGIR